MKKKKTILISLTAAAAVIALIAVLGLIRPGSATPQNEYEKALLGKWAYLHDLDTAAASFQADGRAAFEGQKYSFSCDGSFLTFTGGQEDRTLRYVQSGDTLCLYIRSLYVLEDGRAPSGIAGVWICPEKNWTFEFTDKGTFLEDGILTGHYFVDEGQGTVRLAYEEALEDTVMYYQLTKDGLIVEYPWPMKKIV